MITPWWLADLNPLVWRHVEMHQTKRGTWFVVDGKRLTDPAKIAAYRTVFGIVQ